MLPLRGKDGGRCGLAKEGICWTALFEPASAGLRTLDTGFSRAISKRALFKFLRRTSWYGSINSGPDFGRELESSREMHEEVGRVAAGPIGGESLGR